VAARQLRRIGLAGLRVARARMDELEHEFAAQVGARRWETTRAVLERLFT
jgi:hypothetical protein